jgi:hypothetical protein
MKDHFSEMDYDFFLGEKVGFFVWSLELPTCGHVRISHAFMMDCLQFQTCGNGAIKQNYLLYMIVFQLFNAPSSLAPSSTSLWQV